MTLHLAVSHVEKADGNKAATPSPSYVCLFQLRHAFNIAQLLAVGSLMQALCIRIRFRLWHP